MAFGDLPQLDSIGQDSSVCRGVCTSHKALAGCRPTGIMGCAAGLPVKSCVCGLFGMCLVQDGSLRHCLTNIVIGEGGLRDPF